MSKSLTLFQDWVLFILFKNYGKKMTKEEFMIQCCDTAIGDLTEEKIEHDLKDLEKKRLIEDTRNHLQLEQPSSYKITGNGILTVRKDIIKPVLDLFSRDDYSQILERMSHPLSDKISELRTDSLEGTELNKQTLTSKLIALGVNNIGPLTEFISKIPSYVSTV